MDWVIELMDKASAMSPLAIIALLVTIVAMLVKNIKGQIELKSGQETIASNHLHGLPEMENSLVRIETAINEGTRENREMLQRILLTLTVIQSELRNGRR